MGFWQYNPPEPCCNPPAGWCQCQPARWRIVHINGPPITGADGTDILDAIDHGAGTILKGWTSHAFHLANDHFQRQPPPWFRLWRGLSKSYELTLGDPLREAFYFGFGEWEGLLRFGLAINAANFGKHTAVAPLSGKLIGSPPIEAAWIHGSYSGPHGTAEPTKWNCWGENKLYSVQERPQGGFHPDDYAIVEPA